jgi:hypothetical protein
VKAKHNADQAAVRVPAALDPLERRRRAAEQRVREALSCLEQAQAFIGQAAVELCSVSQLQMEWKVLWSYSDRLEKVCFGVERKVGALRMAGHLLLDYTPPFINREGGEQ